MPCFLCNDLIGQYTREFNVNNIIERHLICEECAGMVADNRKEEVDEKIKHEERDGIGVLNEE